MWHKKISVNAEIFAFRDDWTRTSGPFVPNEVRYRAALHPVIIDYTKIKKPLRKLKSFYWSG